MPHVFRVDGRNFVTETRAIDELEAPAGFVLVSANEFGLVTNMGLVYRSSVYRWKYTGGSSDSVTGQLVEQARPQGARIVRLDGDGFVTGGMAHIKAEAAPAGHIMVSADDYATISNADGHVYPGGRRRFRITGGTRAGATGTLVERSDTRHTGRWSFEGDSSDSGVTITRKVGNPRPTAVLTVTGTPAIPDGAEKVLHFRGGRTLNLTFNGGQAQVSIPTGKATRGDGVVLGETLELRMLNKLTVQILGDLELE